jgi:flagellar biosynthesis/type III secretory pathway M-ring protein FliF/YscJ
MKKIAYFLSLVLLFSAVAPAAMAKDRKEKPENEALSPEETARLEQLDNRFLEIKAMDFESMERDERKEVRKELREINKEAKALGGGVYISTGAIIIILLLIIIL